MGLFDFLRKSSSTPSAQNINSTFNDTSSAFKGDLAAFQDVKIETKSIPNVGTNNMENKDSEDSVVFMDFDKTKKKVWFCPECGTVGDDYYDGCIVCGVKK